MSQFEQFAKELNVKITTDKNGFYTGMCKALAEMTTDVILSEDEKIFRMSWEDQKTMIKEKFFKVFPYMKNAE